MSYASAAGGAFGGVADYQAARDRAAIAYQNAQTEKQLTMEQERQADRSEFLRIGEMRAAGGASGATGGSFGDVLADAAAQLTLQKQSIVFAGNVNAERIATGANVDMAKGNSALIGGGMKAGSDLFAGSKSGGTLTNSGSGAGLSTEDAALYGAG